MTPRRVFDGQRGLVTAIFFASFCLNILILTTPLYMLQLFSRVLSSGSISTLIALTIAAGIALFFYMIFDAVRQRLVSRLANRLETWMGPVILRSVVHGLPGAQDTQPVRDLQDIRTFVTSSTFTALLDAPWSILFVLLIYMFHPLLGIVATVGIATLFTLGIISEIAGRKPAREASAASRKSNMTADEILRNGDIVRAMGKTPALVRRWQAQSFGAVISGTRSHDRVANMTSVAKTVRMLLQIAIMATGVLLVLDGRMGPGMMIAASILLGRAAAPVEQSIAGWRSLIQTRVAVQRLNDLLALNVTEEDRLELPEPQGYLSVQDATLVSPSRQDPLIMGISFDLKPGDSLGLFGPSGAGKTTLARALVGLEPLTRGHVRIDDAALTDWPDEQIGRHIGFLPQRVDLFDGTVAQNIAMMDADARPQDIVSAAKRARVHDLILSLPKGYNTPVGPNGNFLSAGQRQRIGLARAFFGDPCLIVLDEPNSNLDPSGEEALADAIGEATGAGAVVIVISHRMSVLKAVNHVGILENGRLIRFGKAKSELAGDNILPMSGRVSVDTLGPQEPEAGETHNSGADARQMTGGAS